MYIQILGSAAGGGFPQWNCNCVNCKGYRDGTLRATARTQSSIALSDDGEHWILCNASPDIRAQLQAFAPMQPARALRDTGIDAIVLLDSQIDHTTGLLSLREGCPHQVWCTDMVHQDLTTGFPLFNMLSHWNGGLVWNRIELEGSFVIDACPNLRFTPFPLRSGKGVKRRFGQASMTKLPSSSMRFHTRPPFQWLSMLNSGKPVVRSWWTMSVHHTWCGQPSRRLSRPVVWSIWLSSRTMASIPVSRRARAGCIGANAWSWARMSGEALHRIQCSPSSDRAMDDWVRAVARRVPSR